MTEHLFRFRQAEALLGGFWNDERVPPALAESMAEYWRLPRHGRPRRVRGLRARGQGGRPARGHRARGRLLPGPHGRRRHPPGRLPVRRAVGIGALGRGLALRRRLGPALHGRVVQPAGRRLLGGLHRGARGAGGVPGVRRPGPSRPDQGGRATSRTRPTSGGTAWPRRRPRRAWRPRCPRPAGASRWASSIPPLPLLAPPRRARRAADHGIGRPPPRARGRPGRRPARRVGRGRRRHPPGLPVPGSAHGGGEPTGGSLRGHRYGPRRGAG